MLKLSKCRCCMEVLSDPTRAKIVDILSKKSPQTVGSIVAHFQLRQPTISHHLTELKNHGFVKDEKKGLEVFYSLNCKCHRNKNQCCDFLKS